MIFRGKAGLASPHSAQQNQEDEQHKRDGAAGRERWRRATTCVGASRSAPLAVNPSMAECA